MGVIFLVIVTVLWGTTFAVVKDAVAQLPPSMVLTLRFGLGALVMLPLIPWERWRSASASQQPPSSATEPVEAKVPLWRAGLELSLWLWTSYATQTVGLQTTSASRSAFITALNVVFVPIFLIFMGRKSRPAVWLAAAMALTGVGLLSFDGGPPVIGDLWTLGTAVAYALYLLKAEQMVRQHSPLALTTVQLLMMTLLSLGWALASGALGSMQAVPWAAMAYLGIMCTALVVVLQMIGQKTVSAPRAAIIFTMEPVWAAAFAYILLGELLSGRGWLGAALIVGAMVVVVRAPSSPDVEA